MNRRLFGVLLALGLLASACGGTDPLLYFGEVAEEVDGNVVTLPLSADGIEIVAADGDTSGETGHFHVFVDRDPVAIGETIPKEDGIIHSTDSEIVIRGLSIGEHRFTAVMGDGTHTRLGPDLMDERTVIVVGPTVQADAPAELAFGETLNITLRSEGVDIVAANGNRDHDQGHYHVIVDPEQSPQGGQQIPAAEENKVVHSTNSTVAIEDLATGSHEIWIVLGDGTHAAFDPPVMDVINVEVTEPEE